jgi:uncharacterized protein YozE (UPF0346 family)
LRTTNLAECEIKFKFAIEPDGSQIYGSDSEPKQPRSTRLILRYVEQKAPYTMGMTTFCVGYQKFNRVTAAETSAGIVIAIAYQKFHLFMIRISREHPIDTEYARSNVPCYNTGTTIYP